MAELFENFKDIDLPAARKKAREQGWKEGRAEGEARFAKLTQTLLQSNLMDDLTKALSDPAYRDKLYRQYDIL